MRHPLALNLCIFVCAPIDKFSRCGVGPVKCGRLHPIANWFGFLKTPKRESDLEKSSVVLGNKFRSEIRTMHVRGIELTCA